MNITRENTSELELLLKVEICESDYRESVEKHLKDYRKNVTLPGFRKGMAPLPLVKKMYQKALIADEVQKVLSESLYKYIEEEHLEIVGSPLSNDEKTGEVDFNNSDFAFYFNLALMPQLDIKWNELGVKLAQVKISSKEVDEELDKYAKKYGKFEAPEVVGETDVLYGKVVELDKAGNVLEGGIDTHLSFSVANMRKDDIKQLFIDKKLEEKVVFNLAKAYDADTLEEILNMPKDEVKKIKSDFEFTLTGISRITPHELNEELFDKVFPGEELKDIEAFKKRVKKEMEKAYEMQAKNLFNYEVRKALIDQFSAEIPNDFLQRWLASNGEKEGNIEAIKEEWEERYVPAIKWEFIENSLKKIKEIKPTKDEIKAYLKDVLTKYDTRKLQEDEAKYDERIEEWAEKMCQDDRGMEGLCAGLYVDKLYGLYEEQIKPEVEKISIKEFSERFK